MTDGSFLLIEEAPCSGEWNMAVDEALLEHAADHSIRSVRVYGWKEPTVSLGYFQDIDEFADHPTWSKLPAVRRLSGGGAILHHHEITYSCCLPASDRWSRHPPDLYDAVHGAIVDLLRPAGVPIQKRGQRLSDDSQFLCFARGDERDLVIGEHKVMGSAQRRRRGAVLQHGSLLLRRSEYAPQFPGLFDFGLNFAPNLISEARMAGQIGQSITESIQREDFQRVPCLAESIKQRAKVLQDRYRSLEIR
ncbi:MAG: lipoate--protein ligase [Planctomycetota bacterium]|nr:lipoate--protein ligase [Planctomycetota bacterium]